jgi:plastocyanin
MARFSLILGAGCIVFAPRYSFSQTAKVTAQVEMPHITSSPTRRKPPLPPAVLWLKPLELGTSAPATSFSKTGYTLLQKNKMFSPHLLVVPTGSIVRFPNADPFFHNVFSLFNGQRFDLGLYEAGKMKTVTFSREGVSYIFCNIHSDMSAVVVSLSTPFYSIADDQGIFHIDGLPVGEYEMHVWVEGEQQSTLDQWTHRVNIMDGSQNLGTVLVHQPAATRRHSDKFGQPYDSVQHSPY